MSLKEKLVSWHRVIFKSNDSITHISERNQPVIIKDKRTLYVGMCDDHYSFVIICLLFTIDEKNIIDFPNMVYQNGGAIFLCFYLAISIFVVLPIYMLEIGLAQFFSRTVLNIFRIVPVFQGLGWTTMLMGMFTLIFSGIAACSSFIYLVYSIFTNMPWTSCEGINKRYKGINCTKTYSNTSNSGKLPIYLTPSQIFFDIDVAGIRLAENGMKYTLYDGIGTIRLPFFFSLIASWIIIFLCSYIVLELYIKSIYYYFMFILTTLVIITIRTLFLPGSLMAINIFLHPDVNKSFTKLSVQTAVSHCIYSASLGSGIISAISSLNKFHYNFFKGARLIIFGNFIVGIVASLMEFSILGYLASLKNEKIEPYDEDTKLTYFTFLDGVSHLKEARILSIAYSMFMLNINISSNSIRLAGTVLTLIDGLPNLFQYSKKRKIVITSLIGSLLCLLSFIFCFNGSMLYFLVISLQLEWVTCPLIILWEIVIVYFFYGVRRVRSDMKMILGFSHNCIWSFSGVTFIPLLLCISLSYTIYLYTVLKVNIIMKLFSYLITVLVFIPMIIVSIVELYHSFRLSHKLKSLMQSSEYLGPYYKIYWLTGKVYQKKLVKLRRDPQFLQTIPETENIEIILNVLHKLLTKAKLVKQMLKMNVPKMHLNIV